MDRRAKAPWWRPWLLALTLCVFALGYGPSTRMAAHAAHPHASAAADCPGGDRGAGPNASSACCVAHCVPAVPPVSPPDASRPWAAPDFAERSDEHGEGRAVPVPLPPPRAGDRA